MSGLKAVLRAPSLLLIWCPGCDDVHGINPQAWHWDGRTDLPTISPSILVTRPGLPGQCHSFVTDGRIQFLGDCTHPLAGQTVDLPDVPGWIAKEVEP